MQGLHIISVAFSKACIFWKVSFSKVCILSVIFLLSLSLNILNHLFHLSISHIMYSYQTNFRCNMWNIILIIIVDDIILISTKLFVFTFIFLNLHLVHKVVTLFSLLSHSHSLKWKCIDCPFPLFFYLFI